MYVVGDWVEGNLGNLSFGDGKAKDNSKSGANLVHFNFENLDIGVEYDSECDHVRGK